MTETPTNRYDELSDRGRQLLADFDEIDLAEVCASTEAARDGAYRERAHLVALLAAMTDGAVIAPALDLDEPGWWITYLNIGGRQASWHISPRDAGLFRGVERVEPDDPRAQWDGHTTDEKYAGIAAWTTAMAQTHGPIASPLRAQCEATVRMILAGTGAHTVDEWAEYVTAAILPIFRTRIDELRRERDQAIAHDRQPYPTAWAYEKACEALRKHQARADTAEAAIERTRALASRWAVLRAYGSAATELRAALDEQHTPAKE